MLDFAAVPQEGQRVDRETLALLIHTYRAQIKESFRARFATRGLGFYDSSDFFATVLRRADLLTATLDASASHDLRRMLREIVLEALSDCARSALRERRLRRELREPGLRAMDSGHGAGAAALEPEELHRLHLSPEEMHLARLRASGMQHSKVALAFGISAATVRMRWMRLVDKARTWGERHA